MAKTVNKVILLGNCGKDPDIRTTPGGVMVGNLTLATSERGKDKQETTEWHTLVTFGRTAEIVRDYVKKGAKLYVEGRIQTRSWEKDGQKHYRTEIVVNDLCLLDSRQLDSGPAYNQTVAADGYPASAPRHTPASAEISDDDIPF